MESLPIAKVADGQLASLKGIIRAAGLRPLVSPIGERPCVYFDVRALAGEEPERFEAQDFYLEDDTGGRGTLDQQAALIQQLTAKFKGADDVKWAGSVQLKAPRHEVLLLEGAEVTVEGLCRWEPSPDPSAAVHYREVPLRLVVRAPADTPLIITGTSKALTSGRSEAASKPAGRSALTKATPEGRSTVVWWLASAGLTLAGLLHWFFV